MKLADLGEFGLIDLLRRQVEKAPPSEPSKRVILGIGDDVAAWSVNETTIIATTDSLVEGVHFTPATSSATDLGWKALAVNLSDIAAVGGIPEYALITLGLGPETEVDWVTELYSGLLEAANRFDVSIIGGDIVASPGLHIGVTLIGRSSGTDLLTRSAAQSGDLVAVTGYLGSSAGGLQLLQGNPATQSPDASFLIQAHLRPEPRLDEGRSLVQVGVKAAIDISDGLLADLSKLCQASGVSAEVETDLLPIHPSLAAVTGDAATELALSGGEDYELLFTAPEEIIKTVKDLIETPITVIGRVKEGRTGQVILRDSNGQERDWQGGGWDHLAGSGRTKFSAAEES